MFSSMFDPRPRRKRVRADRSPFASSYGRTATPPPRSILPYRRGRTLRYEDEASTSESAPDSDQESEDENHGDNSEEDAEATPLLPIFDSARLDTLPIYTLTHTIRLLVVSRCETVLSWEQLRSPQVSQFLIKPIQQEMRTEHFSAATIYCLMANCLQFTKEVALHPGNSGTSHTRAMICELIAVKLLREYTARNLIDALSYDFDPLQGQSEANTQLIQNHRPSWQSMKKKPQPRSARISCLEIAVRAQAKRLLAHPLVVQQLEAIWDGSIVFHAAADSMHRKRSPFALYGTVGTQTSQHLMTEGHSHIYTGSRKVVTLYNPHDASLFKLSRLRVPRYRNILSTLSFAVLLCLFVAVLTARSLEITSLEIFFWFWAAGYMMNKVVGFTEQGFSLYLASFWNTFDLGILMLLFVHLGLRVYGIVMPDVRKRKTADLAYDILAADAILLFPRLFSVLDHYRYFSQLIIAFRLMAVDLAAVFILIVIACSGFFVALSLSFGYDNVDHPADVAYALFQMLMGFTPAAWDRWNNYTPLGRAILTLFLFICHFLVITILITVLTNSFMAVVKNANEEHQYIFAVNTLLSVKSDELFSYVAPLNIVQWMLYPARYAMSFRQYIKLNRTVIKITHFPILFTIYVYERTVLRSAVVDSIDIVENRKHARSIIAQRLPRLVREPSFGNHRQDQALEEVFKQPFDATLRTDATNVRTKSSTVVNKWMHDMGDEDANPPQEDDPNAVERLERRRLNERSLSAFSRVRKASQRAPSLASDPGEMMSNADFFSPQLRMTTTAIKTPPQIDLNEPEDTADGDDEMMTNDNDNDYDQDDQNTTDTRNRTRTARPLLPVDYFSSRPSPIRRMSLQSDSVRSATRLRGADSNFAPHSPSKLVARKRPKPHNRNTSSVTMIFNPPEGTGSEHSPRQSSNPEKVPSLKSPQRSGKNSPTSKLSSNEVGRRQSRLTAVSRVRPSVNSKDNQAFRSTPDMNELLGRQIPQGPRRASLEMDLVSDIGDNKAIGGGYVGAVPASFATQMALAAGGLKKLQKERTEEQQMFGRLMMARMNTLEEGFREVIHEVRQNMKSNAGSRDRSPERPVQARRERRLELKQQEKIKREKTDSGVSLRGNESAGSGSVPASKQRDLSPNSTRQSVGQDKSEDKLDDDEKVQLRHEQESRPDIQQDEKGPE